MIRWRREEAEFNRPRLVLLPDGETPEAVAPGEMVTLSVIVEVVAAAVPQNLIAPAAPEEA